MTTAFTSAAESVASILWQQLLLQLLLVLSSPPLPLLLQLSGASIRHFTQTPLGYDGSLIPVHWSVSTQLVRHRSTTRVDEWGRGEWQEAIGFIFDH
jgi:hypothetical protein